MTTDFFKRLALMLTLAVVQVLVLNRVHIFNIATPLVYLMLPLHFELGKSRWSALVWCFTTGLVIDIFANTPGVAAGAMTLIGLMQPAILRLFVNDDDGESLTPSFKSMGWLKYLTYSLIITLVYCIAFFSLETFTFFNPILWAECIGGSTLISLVIILAIEKIRS